LKFVIVNVGGGGNLHNVDFRNIFRHTVGCIDVFTKEIESKLPLLFRLYYPTSDKSDPSRETN